MVFGSLSGETKGEENIEKPLAASSSNASHGGLCDEPKANVVPP